MKIKRTYPPNIDKIQAKFKNLPRGVVFTYGEAMYVPYKGQIPKNLEVHEKVHVAQQGDDPEGWWNKYLKDEKFRLEQEVEAYRKQYRFFRQTSKIKRFVPEFLDRIAEDLSGKMYGSIISFEEAKKLIER